MRSFFSTVYKDLLILIRDRAALLILFFMPALLVLVLSLVQNDILESLDGHGFQILLVDKDGGRVSEAIRTHLKNDTSFQIITSLPEKPLTEETARALVAGGDYQFAIILPPGLSEHLLHRARLAARGVFQAQKPPATQQPAQSPALVILSDPALQGIFRVAVTATLRQVATAIEMKERGSEIDRIARALAAARNGAFLWGTSAGPADERADNKEGMILAVREEPASDFPDGVPLLPNAVQQNVPAWTLFGMFFIVVPLSGAILRERREGTLLRLRTLPVSPKVFLLGKICAFTLVCQVQFTLMLLVGRFVLPLFGAPEFDLGGRLGTAYGLALCAALAATGYGLLVGAAARSQEQASMFSAVSIVVAAALGGVMVPIYAMPRFMQTLSVISPFSWGLNGFLEIFVRDGGLAQIYPKALALLFFFAATVVLSVILSETADKH